MNIRSLHQTSATFILSAMLAFSVLAASQSQEPAKVVMGVSRRRM
jgi:hypothetical protein